MSASDWPVDVDPTFGCWFWTSRRDRHGYPITWRGNSPVQAHRVVYEAEVGDIPDGKVLDHLCRNRLCVNPDHLEPVTQAVNLHRREWGVRVRRKTCARGHSMSDCLVTSQGGRLCRTCRREQGEAK